MFNAVLRPVRAVQHYGSKMFAASRLLETSTPIRSLAEDQKGAVAVIFAITSFLVVSMVGGAVDLGRAYSAKAKMQATIDAASLAAASRYVNDENHDSTLAVQQGIKYFTAAMADEPTATMSAELDVSTKTVTSQATMAIKTPFLSMVGINSITIAASSVVTATENLTGGGENDVEMSLMLDVTGSMGASAGGGKTKLQAMQDASKSLIDILIPDTGTAHAKIALAPFAPVVNLGDDYAAQALGLPLTKTTCTQTTNQCVNTTCKSYRSNGTCRTWNQSCTQVCTQTTTTYLRRCVTERMGSEQFTDEGPGDGSYVGQYRPSGDSDAYTSSLSSARSCTPSKTIVPLTNNKTTLKSTIDGFTASGATAGSLGTAWAWYLLSPKWDGVFTGTAAPKPYGTNKLRKIAVLMTDGTYNTENATQYGDGGSDSTRISENAVSICAGMRAANIEVFTVGFKLDNQLAIDTLANCATDPAHHFLAEDADQLTAVFKEIAFRAVPIHVAK